MNLIFYFNEIYIFKFHFLLKSYLVSHFKLGKFFYNFRILIFLLKYVFPLKFDAYFLKKFHLKEVLK